MARSARLSNRKPCQYKDSYGVIEKAPVELKEVHLYPDKNFNYGAKKKENSLLVLNLTRKIIGNATAYFRKLDERIFWQQIRFCEPGNYVTRCVPLKFVTTFQKHDSDYDKNLNLTKKKFSVFI